MTQNEEEFDLNLKSGTYLTISGLRFPASDDDAVTRGDELEREEYDID